MQLETPWAAGEPRTALAAGHWGGSGITTGVLRWRPQWYTLVFPCVPPVHAHELPAHFVAPSYTLQIPMCSGNTAQLTISPATCTHHCSSYYVMLADLPADSCGKPDWGPNPAKNNPVEGVEDCSSINRADWEHMQNHNFRVLFQSNLNTFKIWLPQSHLARKSLLPQASRRSCEVCSQTLQRPEMTANQLCKERWASWQIRSPCHHMNIGKRWRPQQSDRAAEGTSASSDCWNPTSCKSL